MAEAKLVCKTEKEVVAALGKVCAVVGTYELREFRNQKGEVFREWPVVVLAGGGRPVLIESLWDEGKKPAADEIGRYRGKTVEVSGPLHAQPPGRMSGMAVPCISPVASIRVVAASGEGH